ncbi:MAG: hypothetical protein ABI461_03805 [Polyangiaceae bacterium]
MRTLSCFALIVSCAMIGCAKDWPDREIVPVPLNLGNVGTFSISLPSGLKRSTQDGPLAIYEGEGSGAPYVLVSGTNFGSDETPENFIAGSKDGSSFENKDVQGGYGVAYESDGPHVHVQKKVGTKILTCDASMPGGTKDRAKRAAAIFRICTSMK